MVDSINASSGDAWTSVQCDNKAITVTVAVAAANSHAAYNKFLEDLEIFIFMIYDQ